MLVFSQERDSVAETNQARMTARAIRSVTEQYKSPLREGKLKGTVLADLLRLLQMETEPDSDTSVPAGAFWVRSCQAIDTTGE